MLTAAPTKQRLKIDKLLAVFSFVCPRMETVREQFIRFLESKNIDAAALENTEPQLFHEWLQLFAQVHPKSFVAQKLYLINGIRRKYQLKKQ